jgi:MFS family permease
LAYAAYALFMLIGRTFADHLVGRRGVQWLITAGGLLAAVGLLVVAFAPTAVIAIAGFAIVGLGISPVLPMAFVAASHHDPRHTGIAVARVNVGNYIGFVIGAPWSASSASSRHCAWASPCWSPQPWASP